MIPPRKRRVRELIKRWRSLLRVRMRDHASFVLDNALFNQVHYLMALGLPHGDILAFYRRVCAELIPQGTLLISLEGDARVIAKRIMAERMGHWTERVIELIERTPYQKRLQRTGADRLVAFMVDSMAIRKALIAENLLPPVCCDVTAAKWTVHTKEALEGIARRYPN